MLTNILSFVIAFVSVMASVLILRPLATNFGLVDKPSQRKQHTGEVPLVGGLAIFVAVSICSFIFTPFETHYKIYMLSISFMVLIGALDDFHDIDAGLRLIAQFLIGSLMVFGADLYISSLGAVTGTEPIQLGLFAPIFTVLAVVTCINAFNMTDGVDGLVGTLSLSTFVSVGTLALLSPVHFDNSLTLMFCGAVIAFLFFNFGFFSQGRYKVFMGDAGSMLIGLTVIWLLTFISQGNDPLIRPVTALWLIAIPLMDMFSVILRRGLANRSPLQASRDHIHHVFLNCGYSNRATTANIGILSLLFSTVGIVGELTNVKEVFMSSLFVVSFVVYNLVMMRLDKRMRVYPE